MLKLKKYNSESFVEPIVLNLVELEEGGIALVVCDKRGEAVHSGKLLEITREGTIRLEPHRFVDLGFKLDKNGQVIIEKL